MPQRFALRPGCVVQSCLAWLEPFNRASQSRSSVQWATDSAASETNLVRKTSLRTMVRSTVHLRLWWLRTSARDGVATPWRLVSVFLRTCFRAWIALVFTLSSSPLLAQPPAVQRLSGTGLVGKPPGRLRCAHRRVKCFTDHAGEGVVFESLVLRAAVLFSLSGSNRARVARAQSKNATQPASVSLP